MCSGKSWWGNSPSGEKCSGAGDRRHAETNYIIEKWCLETGDRKHAEMNCKINTLVGRGKELEGSWEEWSQVYD